MNKLFKLSGKTPKIGKDCFIAPGAIVGGEIIIGDEVGIWFNTVARADVAPIYIGDQTNIQDLCMLHVTDDIPLIIKARVSVGHSVTLHSCEIKENCLIGMGSTILDGAVIGRNSLVAAGSLVTPGKVFPEFSKIMGNPAKVVGQLDDDEVERYGQHYRSYLVTKDLYLKDKNFCFE